MKSINVFIVIIILSGLVLPASAQNDTTAKAPQKVGFKTFRNAGSDWGYDIYVDGKLYVHQPHIPATSGNTGFKNERDAKNTAELVVKKIKKNILPPSISIEELEKLGVVKKSVPPKVQKK